MTSFKPSYVHIPRSRPLCALTVGQVVDIAAEKWKDKQALVSIYQGHRYTFSEVRDEADRLAASLMQMGMKHGDRLGIFGPNSSEWYISRLAAARGGFIAVQLDPAYQAPQLEYSINKVGIKVLISTEFYKSNNCYPLIQAVVPELDNCTRGGAELTCSKVPSLKRIIIMSDTQYKGTYQLKDVINSAQPALVQKIRDEQILIQPDDGCAIQFSSGTTGTPKGALLSHHNLVNCVIDMGNRLCLDIKNPKLIIVTQFCHTSGSVGGILCGLCFGVTCVLASPVFDSLEALEGIIKEKCTHILATPSLYVDMITKAKENALNVTTLEYASYGGAPCSPKLAMDLQETLHAKHIIPGYGMTELGLGFSAKPEDTLEQRMTTVGHPAENCEIKIVDKEGRMVPWGQPGELWIRGYGVMLGYWGDEKKTREFIGQDGWAKTGDLFILNEDGTAKIIGRVKDLIIRKGDKIFPSEVEEFFTTQHPDVLECQAFGVPDPNVGEEICVFLRLREGVTYTEDDIREYCKDKIPEYRIPRYIRFVKEFPRTAIGKVQRIQLLEQLMKELGIN